MNINGKKSFGHILAILTILIWGTTFIASKLLLEDYSPSQLMLMRFTLGYIILFLLKPKIIFGTLKEEAGFFLLGITGVTLYYFCENVALTYTLTSNVSIIVAFAPIITAIFAHFFTHDEKINKNIIIGFIIALSGVALVVFNGRIILRLNPLGDVLALLAALCWGIYSILLKGSLNHFTSIILARKTMFYGIITTLPFVLIEGRHFEFTSLKSPVLLFCLIFLAVLGSGICYVTWNVATKVLGVITTNNYIYFIPFITMLTAAIVLKEKITVMGILGAVLITFGVFISSYRKNQVLKSSKKLDTSDSLVAQDVTNLTHE